MTPEVRSSADPTMTALVSGIVNDTQELLKQQMALIHSEIREDMRKTKEAVLRLALGLGVVVIGSLLLVLALPWLLTWIWPDLHIWAAYAIVGGVLVGIGGTLLLLATRRLSSFNPLPDQSYQALKENMRWITNPK